jgi:hypothetical protein
VALIELYDVRPDDDEAFLADWHRECNGTLYRALRDDAAPRFLSIAADGAYELVHEDGTADPAGGAVRIEAFDNAQLRPPGARPATRSHAGAAIAARACTTAGCHGLRPSRTP